MYLQCMQRHNCFIADCFGLTNCEKCSFGHSLDQHQRSKFADLFQVSCEQNSDHKSNTRQLLSGFFSAHLSTC